VASVKPVLLSWHLVEKGQINVPATYLDLSFRIEAASPLRVQSVNGSQGENYRLSGASIKAILRREATLLVPALESASGVAQGAASGAVCRLFGAPGIEAQVRWADATVIDERGMATAYALQRRRVHRALRTHADFPVSSTLVQAPGPSFQGKGQGWLDAHTARSDAALLVSCLNGAHRIGGNRSIGMGWVRLKLDKLLFDGVEQDVDLLLHSSLDAEAR
jgi:CRISPR/Cas system CSM-associated protein Csm3 (group 7 of RAMP superfamily)